MNRITYLAAAGALVATSGLGAWAANAATDDASSTHVRTRMLGMAPTTPPVTATTTATVPTTRPATTRPALCTRGT